MSFVVMTLFLTCVFFFGGGGGGWAQGVCGERERGLSQTAGHFQ